MAEKSGLEAKLLGPLVLCRGGASVEENSARQPRPWLLLKYLLVNPGRQVGLEELQNTVWPEDRGQENAPGRARVRLRRLREDLEPLGLGGPRGLVLFKSGCCSLNPAWAPDTDTARLLALLARLRPLPLEDPAGLALCREGLALFRGPLLAGTAAGPWLSPLRAYYARRFGELARSCLQRMQALGDSGPAALLSQQAAALAPQDEPLQRAVLHYLMAQGLELELLRYVPRLSASGAAWLAAADTARLF